MYDRIESLGRETPERKMARATALRAMLDRSPETDPNRFDRAQDAYLAEPDGVAE
ncbi:hypothetical protein GCM10009617_36340 [Leifsonia poae]|uniref:Uncharacterized protein n=1 Tax=Leifsonia poae TaxID=110933 RepID=A0A9W6HAN9_9MICO|nr:hypothetical protein GCM10017584_21130 [Leifsonia poae]